MQNRSWRALVATKYNSRHVLTYCARTLLIRNILTIPHSPCTATEEVRNIFASPDFVESRQRFRRAPNLGENAINAVNTLQLLPVERTVLVTLYAEYFVRIVQGMRPERGNSISRIPSFDTFGVFHLVLHRSR